MNTEAESKKVSTLKKPEDLKGVWILDYKLVNSEGIKGFSGRAISSYTDPLTGKARHLFNADGQFVPFFLMDKVRKTLKPHENSEHRLLVDWLVGHPEIGVNREHVGNVDSKYFERKQTNPRFTLINRDHVVTTDLDEEHYIDKLIGKFSLEGGPNAIGHDKLRFILSALNKPYMNPKHVTDKSKEKKFLRKDVKDFIRSGINNAKKVEKILDDLTGAKFLYEIKEMARVGVLFVSNGMYKYEGVSLGTSIESVTKYFVNNIEIYQECTGFLYTKLKEERGY